MIPLNLFYVAQLFTNCFKRRIIQSCNFFDIALIKYFEVYFCQEFYRLAYIRHNKLIKYFFCGKILNVYFVWQVCRVTNYILHIVWMYDLANRDLKNDDPHLNRGLRMPLRSQWCIQLFLLRLLPFRSKKTENFVYFFFKFALDHIPAKPCILKLFQITYICQ